MGKHIKLAEILGRLNKAYGAPRPFKATDPVDELIRTVLSQNTNDRNSLAAFAALKRDFRTWEALIRSDTRRISRSIRRAGLANIKAGWIKDILIEIRRCEGSISLRSLRYMNENEALSYLRSLKGVGPKTAACVLLFSFGMPVMPVDTHIFRIAKRLGLIAPKVSIEEAHTILTDMSKSAKKTDLIYNLHLGIIEHGRRTCKAQNPRCGFCVLRNMCGYGDKASLRKEDSVDKKSHGRRR